jgi:hypothetical protein
MSTSTYTFTYTPLLTTLTDPWYLYPLIACCAFQVIMYFTLIRLFPKTFATEKQRGWILTGANAFVLTVISIPFIYKFLFLKDYYSSTDRHQLHFGRNATLSELASGYVLEDLKYWDRVSKPTCAFFVSYLLGDLILGQWLYPSQVMFVNLFSSFLSLPRYKQVEKEVLKGS